MRRINNVLRRLDKIVLLTLLADERIQILHEYRVPNITANYSILSFTDFSKSVERNFSLPFSHKLDFEKIEGSMQTKVIFFRKHTYFLILVQS